MNRLRLQTTSEELKTMWKWGYFHVEMGYFHVEMGHCHMEKSGIAALR